MKRISCALFVLLSFASCKKEKELAKIDYGCIGQSQVLTSISGADSVTVYGLFQANQFSTDSLVFNDYDAHWQMDNDLVYNYYQDVNAVQIKNGLPVFYGDVYVQFTYGYANSISGKYDIIVNLPHKPSLNYQKLRSIYLDEGIIKNQINASFRDSCYVAQFGYYNLSRDTPWVAPKLITAWKVRPKGSKYPVGYFKDSDGSAIYFQVSGFDFPGKF